MIVPVPVAIVVAVVVIWITVPRIVNSMAVTDAVLANQQVAAEFKTIRAYYTENIVNKVVQGGAFQANVDHKENAKVIPLPATFLHDLGMALKDNETSVTLFSLYPFPGHKDRQLDDFQQQAWTYLTAHPTEIFSRPELREGKHVVRVAVADTMSSQTCINCHNSDARSPKTDWELGDVRGVLEVSSIIDAQLAHGATLGQLMMVGTGVIGLLLLGMTLWVTRTVTRPLRGMVRDMAKIATAIAAAVEEQSAATTEIARNVDHAADSTGRVAGNIGDVNRAARETSNASSQVLASARVLSGEGAKFRLTVERFLKTVRAA